MKVLLDTDIGNDIDDAVALAYLLRQPKCDLIGITAVTGQAQKRAALCEIVCRAAGREDIPIHLGREEPLLTGPGQPNPRQYEAVSDLPHRVDRPANTVVEFLRQTIRENPGEITLLSIGPLSNIALLFAIDPEVSGLLAEFVSMAGSFFPGAPEKEWNCRVDLLATAMVFNGSHTPPPNPHRNFGLDVTMKCRMSADEVRTRFNVEPLSTVLQMAEQWFHDSSEITFHDPLAASCLFKPELCSYLGGKIEADLEGKTTFTRSDQAQHEVAQTVDSGAFFEEFFSVFK
ncbi:MAG: nucleoside hydrolase [Chlorobia bacterium]|nr:nucleoside hydrolase [Fimbriimonadaceae bacterium]